MTPGATVAPKPPTLSPITVISDRTEDGGVEFKGGERENSDYDPAIRAIKGLTDANKQSDAEEAGNYGDLAGSAGVNTGVGIDSAPFVVPTAGTAQAQLDVDEMSAEELRLALKAQMALNAQTPPLPQVFSSSTGGRSGKNRQSRPIHPDGTRPQAQAQYQAAAAQNASAAPASTSSTDQLLGFLCTMMSNQHSNSSKISKIKSSEAQLQTFREEAVLHATAMALPRPHGLQAQLWQGTQQ